MKTTLYSSCAVLCLMVFLSSCGNREVVPKSGATVTSSGVFANQNNARFIATFDGKPIELTDSNRFGGLILGGMSNDGKTKIYTVNFTIHGKERSDYVLTIDYMDGKTGTTNNVNAIVNFPRGQSFTGKEEGKATATVTRSERKDDNYSLYSGEFEVEMVKITMGDERTYILKGTFENILVITSPGILKTN